MREGTLRVITDGYSEAIYSFTENAFGEHILISVMRDGANLRWLMDVDIEDTSVLDKVCNEMGENEYDWIAPMHEVLNVTEIKDGGTGSTSEEQALENLGAAAYNHEHDEYAPASHSHSGYAASSHTHSEYAKSSHSHTGYAEENHTHRYSDLDFIPEPKVLWSGASHMNGSQTAALLEPVSYQPKGIVLVFSPYNGTAAVDNAFVSYHISKELVSLQPSKSHTFQMNDADMTTFGFKTLRIGDKNIGGEAVNSTKGTKNGITFDNSKFVLRYVLGE